METAFRKLNEYENRAGILSMSPTDMAKCPIQLKGKKMGTYKYVYTDTTKKIFSKGSEIHILEGIWRGNSRNHVNTELHMSAITLDNKLIFSGYADFIMVNDMGLYIEDLKTCNRGAFYHFNKEAGAMTEIIQLSCYRYLYYITHNVLIEHGVITKIDRDNTLNRISLEIPLWSISQTEKFILYHPTVRFLKCEIDEELFLKEVKKFIKANRWICKFCQDQETCIINDVLEIEEAAVNTVGTTIQKKIDSN